MIVLAEQQTLTSAAAAATGAARRLRGEPGSEHQMHVLLPFQEHPGAAPAPTAAAIEELPAGIRGKSSAAPTPGFAVTAVPSSLGPAQASAMPVPMTPTVAPTPGFQVRWFRCEASCASHLLLNL